MPHKRIPFLTGHYYHIYNRGQSRMTIFEEHDNYLFVQKKMALYAARFDLTVIAYCLMPNHYHFLIRQDGDHRAGLLPQRVFNSYTKAYNKRYNHSGTLFESQFKAKQIDHNTHLLHLCRYIHLNPVKDGLTTHPGKWPYSDYLAWMGDRTSFMYDPEFIIKTFQSKAEYQNFIIAGLQDLDSVRPS